MMLKISSSIRCSIAAVLVTFLSSAGMVRSETPPRIILASNGTAQLPLLISPHSSPALHALVDTLTNYLHRISNASFEVVTSSDAPAILLGVASNFPAVAANLDFDGYNPLRREEYLLRTHSKGLHIIGASDMALQNAVWDLLYSFGYRQFFPGDVWEVVPELDELAITVNRREAPDFHTRLIWYGHGTWVYNVKPYADWCIRNRATRAFELRSAHMYQALIRHNREVFEAHPEYLALVNGERKGNKLCISNPGLRQLAVDYTLQKLRNAPPTDCVSAEPSDGGGWCECEACARLGSISDQALTLANQIARAVREEFPHTYVGLLAYNMHSPPPSIRVEPNVIVKAQTHFIRGGYSHDQLLTGWQAQGAAIGVGDYYQRSRDSRPGHNSGSNLAHIRSSIPHFHQAGARFFMTESGDLWGCIGLGHYLASRLLWNVAAAAEYDQILDDFFVRAFGEARQPMEAFFRRIYLFAEDDLRPLIRSDLVARLYRDLAEARRLAANNPAVLARIDDLLLYARYEDLHQRYENAKGDERNTVRDELLRHIWRMRTTMMVHAKPEFRRLATTDKESKPDTTPWQDNRPFTEAEKVAMIAVGIAHYQPLEPGFKPVSFSDDLVPATPLKLPEGVPGTYNQIAPIGRQLFYTWRNSDDPPFKLRLSGGHIVHYRSIASPVQVSLKAAVNPLIDEIVAFDDTTPPDGSENEITLTSSFEGLHTIQIFPPANRAMVEHTGAMAMTLPAALDNYNQLTGRWSLYFYVPRGTTVVGGYSQNGLRGLLLDSSGTVQCDFSKLERDCFFKVDVPPGQDGTLWHFKECFGRRALLTVPPWMATSANALLLPREVVERDIRP